MTAIHSEPNVVKFLSRMNLRAKEINRRVIDPIVPDVTRADIEALLAKNALVRGAYFKKYMEISQRSPDSLPTAEEIDELRLLRRAYQEMTTAVQAVEAAVEKDYLSIKDWE